MTVSSVNTPPPLRPPDVAASGSHPRNAADTARERAEQPPPRAPLPPGQGARIDVLA